VSPPEPLAGEGVAKAPRADAVRNRTRVLEAADAVFLAKGTGASTEEVARAAGVGVGTVFRHFPTKEALLAAVFTARLERMAEEADALAASSVEPGVALFSFFTSMVERAATKQAFVDALAAAGVDVQQRASGMGRELREAMDALLARAQRAGAVRDDIRAADLIALLIGVSRAAEHAGWDPEAQARTLRVVLDGLRPPPEAP
jgi:AcrR family transcriptional regulator